jgi:hypothetical protein
MLGRLRKWLHRRVRAKDSAAPDLTIEEIRSVTNTADYLADAIKAAPGGQLNPDDLEKLKRLGANLDDLKDKVKRIKG